LCVTAVPTSSHALLALLLLLLVLVLLPCAGGEFGTVRAVFPAAA
jgi:hypothetical protein